MQVYSRLHAMIAPQISKDEGNYDKKFLLNLIFMEAKRAKDYDKVNSENTYIRARHDFTDILKCTVS